MLLLLYNDLMGSLKTSVNMHLEVTAQVDRLRGLCNQLELALRDAEHNRRELNDLTARARSAIAMIWP